MAALAIFADLTAGAALRDTRRDQLIAVATSRLDDLENVTGAWGDRARLVSSRTQLRVSLRRFAADPDPAERDRIDRILEDAVSAAASIRSITAYDRFGRPAASTEGEVAELPELDPANRPDVFESLLEDPRVEDGELRITFVAALDIEEDLVGWAEIGIDARELIDLTDDTAGLGRTGETLIAIWTPEDDAVILNSPRHDPAPPMTLRVIDDGQVRPAFIALRGGREQIAEDAVDYRGAHVWAATRYLEDLGWGLVVKFDAEEVQAPIAELRESLLRVGISLSAFAVVLGTLLGIWFARPIRELAAVADRIHGGELDMRAPVRTHDEVGRLADTFNRMTGEILGANQELRRRLDTGEYNMPWSAKTESSLEPTAESTSNEPSD